MLEIADLTHSYADGHTAIDGLTLSVEDGSLVSLVGPSGCGKSTLLRCIAGLIRPTGGTVTLNGRPIDGVPDDLAVVFQDYSRSLFPWLTVRDNVALPLKRKGLSRSQRREAAEKALAEVGLPDAGRKYHWQLSGGMQQRVAIARALAYKPSLLLMDEPFGAVDAQTREDLEDLVLALHRSQKMTILLVTHDIDESVYVGDRVVVLGKSPAGVKADLVVDLPSERDQIETRANPEFIRMRAEVGRLIRSTPKPAASEPDEATEPAASDEPKTPAATESKPEAKPKADGPKADAKTEAAEAEPAAKAEADDAKAKAKTEIEDAKADAKTEADDAKADAKEEIDNAKTDAKAKVAEAKSEAKAQVTKAKADAQDEVDEAKSDATSEADEAKAEAEAEAQAAEPKRRRWGRGKSREKATVVAAAAKPNAAKAEGEAEADEAKADATSSDESVKDEAKPEADAEAPTGKDADEKPSGPEAKSDDAENAGEAVDAKPDDADAKADADKADDAKSGKAGDADAKDDADAKAGANGVKPDADEAKADEGDGEADDADGAAGARSGRKPATVVQAASRSRSRRRSAE
ncbi:ABC-type nitrate/sulfonate/bicarbonate transport system ATPase subunit/F0F1-type ATP synthase membrane subunit b/b' [Actinomadura rupiterrae]|nr:ABC-type nitrate/sulfonate/bicarbonate transport system ATPase subunit/F0F1-type ATP synthase membrane subunit b/b' [Actinomadura rupiterrae]